MPLDRLKEPMAIQRLRVIHDPEHEDEDRRKRIETLFHNVVRPSLRVELFIVSVSGSFERFCLPKFVLSIGHVRVLVTDKPP